MTGQNFDDLGRELNHRPEYHRPKFYRYRVADRGLRLTRNQYANQFSKATIGLALVVGRHAYCVKWASAELKFL
ncbi:hypothetical protein [Streptomyces sp. Je 1-369]|uniref:hypothetical protein n=1 Tax=Streptomyces sp. Je 1-369 TaxID=2966192 RepID=UPI002285D24D|nr:hypothetical protein [Streptomyces sp. Je 1-369]WAL93956.1 hypothetical protein NOO62_05255 [Streptomyces sp. Je 1-369]